MTARCLLQADIVSQVYKAFTGRFEWWKRFYQGHSVTLSRLRSFLSSLADSDSSMPAALAICSNRFSDSSKRWSSARSSSQHLSLILFPRLSNEETSHSSSSFEIA